MSPETKLVNLAVLQREREGNLFTSIMNVCPEPTTISSPLPKLLFI